MTVLPFSKLGHAQTRGEVGSPLIAVPAYGTFMDTSGRVGSFLGTYRLAYFVEDLGLPAAVGVFAGRLDDADGALVGMASRRNTAAVRLDRTEPALSVWFGPLQVRLFGFTVRIAELELPVVRSEDRTFLLTKEL